MTRGTNPRAFAGARTDRSLCPPVSDRSRLPTGRKAVTVRGGRGDVGGEGRRMAWGED